MNYVKLQEVALFVKNGATIKQDKECKKGFPITRIETLANDKFNRDRMGYANIYDLSPYYNYVLEDGDILFSHINGEKQIGRAIVYEKLKEEKIIHGMNLLCIRVNKNKVIPKFLEYSFKSNISKDFIKKNTKKAVNQASIPASKVLECPIILYEIEKQQKIVNELNLIQQQMNMCKNQILLLDQMIKSQFIEMFGDLTSNYDYPKFKINDLAFVTKLAGFEFTEYINYQSNGDIIMLRGLNCKNGKLVLDDIKWIDVETSKKLPRSQLFNGDILMTYAGTVGDVALVDEDDKYHLAPNVAKISLNDKLSNNPIFFIHLFMFTKDYILSNTAGVAQMALSMKKIRDFEYHIPPIELQNKFADFVQQIDKSKITVQKQIDLLEELLELKMNEYFGDRV